eukprot:10702653-Alexandrium_andersonii.AAC.1
MGGGVAAAGVPRGPDAPLPSAPGVHGAQGVHLPVCAPISIVPPGLPAACDEPGHGPRSHGPGPPSSPPSGL